MQWILILTFWGWGSSSGSAIAQVGPFKDRESCHAAAAEWLKKASEAPATPFAVCAQTERRQ